MCSRFDETGAMRLFSKRKANGWINECVCVIRKDEIRGFEFSESKNESINNILRNSKPGRRIPKNKKGQFIGNFKRE